MKARAETLSTNGNSRKSKKTHIKGLTKINVDVDLERSNSRELLHVLTEVKNGNFTVRMPIDETGLSAKINDTLNQLITNLRETTIKNQDQDWLKSNLAKFAVMLQGQKDLSTLTKRILSELAKVVPAHYGAFYILQSDETTQAPKLKLYSAYAYKEELKIPKEFSLGEGLVGQCAFEKERILIKNVPTGYVKINSALGKAKPSNVVILPVLFEKRVKAVIELTSLNSFSEMHLVFLNQLTESIGIVLNTIEAFTRTEELLAQAQSQAVELKARQEELRINNDKLEDQAVLLVKQKEEVEAKHKELAFQNDENEKRAAELSIANIELAFQNDEKEKRAAELSLANKEVEDSKRSLEEKAAQLALTSKYKSEFLANMSHELRSPLNSLLILAQQLYENDEGNLSDKEVRYARTIYSCGDDLIQLINDILDLSKIESGVISINTSTVRISEIASFIETTYKPISESRNLKFRIKVDEDMPASIDTDMLRLNQILKNLLSNAFKFTEKGEVVLKIGMAKRQWKSDFPALYNAKRVVSFSVRDTGIGIPAEKLLIIFEAFQQAEGSTSRKYGGTGLGLSICRGLIELLGGAIEVKSEVGRGSKFTIFLPLDSARNISVEEEPQKSFDFIKHGNKIGEVRSNIIAAPSVSRKNTNAPGDEESVEPVRDDTDDDKLNIEADDKIILVVEDDLRFAKIMIEKAHENGMKAIVATNYHEVFDFINRFHPIAITLDVNLPVASGWKVIHMLRSDLMYSHIPIHVISGEENRILALKQGARSFLLKPLENGLLNQLFIDMLSFSRKEVKSILIVEDNEIDSSQIVKMLSDDKIDITIAETSKAAIELIAKKDYDCIILDYTLPDMPGNDVVHEIAKAKKIFTPVIVYSIRDFNTNEINNVNFNSNSHIMKGVDSIETLLAETVSQLHINHKDLAKDKQKIIEDIRNKKDILTGKNILVVDDDVRNLFAMTTVFERFNMKVVTAESGMEAISILAKNPKIEMVLMDIMMPEMDGYEVTQKIRREHKNNKLPIIAVTAKAMKRDREKCIEAGASDYITKPVKTDQLLSLMRLWFCKQ